MSHIDNRNEKNVLKENTVVLFTTLTIASELSAISLNCFQWKLCSSYRLNLKYNP